MGKRIKKIIDSQRRMPDTRVVHKIAHVPNPHFNIMKKIFALLATLALGLSAASAAPIIAFTEGGTSTSTGGTGLVGFNFTVNTDISVTQLGWYGQDVGGGDTPWVAIYNTASPATALASITTGYTTTPGWQYQSLGTPVTLTTGNTYQVVATLYWTQKYDPASFTYASEINPVGFTTPGGWGGWGNPVMATNSLTSTPSIAANFQYSAVPEPSTYVSALMLMGVGSVLFFRRRLLA
jgi:hypothetical protein